MDLNGNTELTNITDFARKFVFGAFFGAALRSGIVKRRRPRQTERAAALNSVLRIATSSKDSRALK